MGAGGSLNDLTNIDIAYSHPTKRIIAANICVHTLAQTLHSGVYGNQVTQ